MKPGTHDVPAQIDDSAPVAPVAPHRTRRTRHRTYRTIRSPSMTRVPSDWTPPGRTRSAPDRTIMNGNISVMPVLGIDVGGTKTVCLLADDDERVIAEGREEGANLQGAGELALEKVLHSVMEKTLEGTGVVPSAICLGIAGVDRAVGRSRRPQHHEPHRLQGAHSRRQRRAHRAAGRRRRRGGHRDRVGNGIDRVWAQRPRRSVAGRRLGLRARRRRQRLLDRPPRAARRRPARRRPRSRHEPDAAAARALRRRRARPS